MLIELAVRPYYHALYFVLFEFIPLISPIRLHSVFTMAASEKKREKKTDFPLDGRASIPFCETSPRYDSGKLLLCNLLV